MVFHARRPHPPHRGTFSSKREKGFPAIDARGSRVRPKSMSMPAQKPPSTRQRIIRIGEREIVTEGLDRLFLNDLYHDCMTASWPRFLCGAAAVFVCVNLFYALLYSLGENPVANAPSGLNLQLFYFSIETLATVGYGDMHPQTHYGHLVASVEIFTGMVLIAMMTGLIFARFSRPRARLIFARNPVIGHNDGKPTLMIRAANARHNMVADAQARLWMTKAETNAEGNPIRRFYALALQRTDNPLFILSWTLFHPIDEASPLFGMTEADFEAVGATFVLSIQGHDTTFAQDIRARQNYAFADVRWNHRYKDILHTDEDGRVHLNHAIFHDVVPQAPPEAGKAAPDAAQPSAQTAESVTR